MPTHHLHISTGFMFMTALFVVAFVAVIFAFVRSMRNDRLDAEARMAEIRAQGVGAVIGDIRPQETPFLRSQQDMRPAPSKAEVDAFMPYERYAPRPGSTMTQPPMPYNGLPPHYAAVAPVYAHDPLTGLATGMLIGSALSHGHDHTTTIIHDSAPSYVDSGPSYSSSSSSDSGFSYSDSSSSSSYDSGSSSDGFDASW